MTRSNGRCYEDFEVGLVMRHALGRTIPVYKRGHVFQRPKPTMKE